MLNSMTRFFSSDKVKIRKIKFMQLPTYNVSCRHAKDLTTKYGLLWRVIIFVKGTKKLIKLTVNPNTYVAFLHSGMAVLVQPIETDNAYMVYCIWCVVRRATCSSYKQT